jgi:dUTP pyrophosphatase
MGGDRNTVHLVTGKGVESWPQQSKVQVAQALMPASPRRSPERLGDLRDRGPDPAASACRRSAAAGLSERVRVRLDLLAAIPAAEPISIAPGRFAAIPTGITIALPAGLKARCAPLRPRRTPRHYRPQHPGTIDADYRGEIAVILINHGANHFTVTRGMRIAQLVISPIAYAQLRKVEKLAETARGSAGFGSTGVKSDRF